MPLYTASINSGSNGNCYYIGNDNEAVLIDVGLTCKEIERRMARLELSLKKVKAIFISHEHSDHIKGVVVLSRKYDIPVYITPATVKHGRIALEQELSRIFTAYEPVQVGELTVIAFPKFHDASDPHSFVVKDQTTTVGVFTDIGRACPHLVDHFRQCHAAFLESNYDADMLDKGRYPVYLKKRIRGGEGHLSNHQALELFLEHRPAFMSHLFLAHLSRDNNDPQLAYELFRPHMQGAYLEVASRYNESAVHVIQGRGEEAVSPKRVVYRQMQLFSETG